LLADSLDSFQGRIWRKKRDFSSPRSTALVSSFQEIGFEMNGFSRFAHIEYTMRLEA
jgi:hypothetical protein